MRSDRPVALVLGAVKGIGKQVGLALAADGYQVVLNWFDWEESLKELESDAAPFGENVWIRRTDLTDCGAVRDMVAGIETRFGRLDVLVNNIERGGWPVVHGPYVPEQWDLEIATTLRAKRWVFDAAFPLLKSSGNGCVINLSSIAGLVGRAGPASLVFNDGYAAANRAVSSLTETWARIGAPEVRVNEIMLGFFETRHGERTRGWALLTDEQKQALIDHTPLGRIGRREDVVRIVRFLINDAPFMTGAVLRLDGGYVLGGEKVAPMPQGVL
ncbi:MAG: SDR family NAD(P)-dependent oxidoreductase [Desulfobacterales bacterium]